MKRSLAVLGALACAAIPAGCGGSSSTTPAVPTIEAAKTYGLEHFAPAGAIRPGMPTTLSFTIRQPSGTPLVQFKRGSGPHTGVHLIIVRSDLGAIIHRHPPVAANGRISQTVVFPTPGRYRMVVDAYPAVSQLSYQPNFQLFRWITVAGKYTPQPLPPPTTQQTVDGYRYTIVGHPKLKAVEAVFLKIRVTGPDGKPARFTPWYGALAHAIFFRRGSLDYFHTHVCAPGATNCGEHARRHARHGHVGGAGEADRRRARARRRNLAAVPPDEARRPRRHGPVHVEGHLR
jgi:hypothetical protein